MIVRPALRSDLIGIGRVSEAAHWASYDGLLRPDTIGRLLARDFGPGALARRLLRGGMRVVAVEAEVVAFVDGVSDDDSLAVDAIAVDPAWRRRGAGTALLAEAGRVEPRLPMTAAVLLGNLEGEGFYEANGFVPGEIAATDLFGQEVVERRWWRESQVGAERLRRSSYGG